MPLVAAYHRPTDLDEARALLADGARIPLAGGTVINADREGDRVEVVDLQELGLTGVELDGDRVRVGAMTTLAEFSRSDLVPAWLADVARAEMPSTLRTLATVGGTVATRSWDSVLYAALLVSRSNGGDRHPFDLDEAANGRSNGCLSPPFDLITHVTFDGGGIGAVAATGRTPADVPIVAAVARRTPDGEILLALTGVADVPVLVDSSDPTTDLIPPSDFRGSSAYRLELAGVLSARALEAVRP